MFRGQIKPPYYTCRIQRFKGSPVWASPRLWSLQAIRQHYPPKSWPHTEGFSADTLSNLWNTSGLSYLTSAAVWTTRAVSCVMRKQQEEKTLSPHQASPNTWRRIPLEKLILQQLWRRFVDLRGAGWDHPLPSVVFWLKAASGQLDGPRFPT